jgi:hypothetical protein
MKNFKGNYIKKLEIGAGKSVGFGGLHIDGPVNSVGDSTANSTANSTNNSHRIPGSIQHTRTFYPPSNDKAFLWSQISLHLESACAKLRHACRQAGGKGLVASRVSFFLKTSGFEYIRGEATLPDPTAVPQDILKAIEPEFENLWKRLGDDSNAGDGSNASKAESAGAYLNRGLIFRAAGISLSGLQLEHGEQQTRSLFEMPAKADRSRLIHRTIDRLARRYGKHAVFLGSSFKALKADGDLTKEGKARAFDVIYLGEVS